jgi:hypothetical protein
LEKHLSSEVPTKLTNVSLPKSSLQASAELVKDIAQNRIDSQMEDVWDALLGESFDRLFEPTTFAMDFLLSHRC